MSDSSVPDRDADPLFERVFAELKTLARHHMAGERNGHTLQATALVGEAWLRLRNQVDEARDNPARFYAAAAESMRRILIEHARRRGAQKRGGGLQKLSLDLAIAAESVDCDQVLAIDAAIDSLSSASPRAAELVRLRFFAGLTEVDAATVMGISERTARREWNFARAWLFELLQE